MPVQAAHSCPDKACVWNQGPPNCTMTTCRHQHKEVLHCFTDSRAFRHTNQPQSCRLRTAAPSPGLHQQVFHNSNAACCTCRASSAARMVVKILLSKAPSRTLASSYILRVFTCRQARALQSAC